MKIAYLIGGMSAIIMLVGGYVVMNKPSVNKDKESHIMLYKEYGFITWKAQDDTEYRRVEGEETKLPNNVYVKTVEGRGYVILPDNSSISLDKNTEILVSYAEEGVSVMQYLGSTYHRVQSLVAGKSYNVSTPNTLATVRGTKFMVTYDDKKKTSQVDVTEHLVEVNKLRNNMVLGQATALSEGGTAIIKATTTGDVVIDINPTADIQEKNKWFEENKVLDRVIDQGGNKRESIIDLLKTLRATGNGEDRLEKINAALKDKINESTTQPAESKSNETPKQETKPESKKGDIKKSEEIKEKEIAPTTQITPQIKKVDEEVFFDKFNTLFVDNFYLDDKDTACNGKTAEERVRIVSSYASESGYPFTSKTLLSFAQAITAYCADKSAETKTKLQARFDDEFPFND